MSWDILIMILPSAARSAREIPDDFKPGTLGFRSELISKIRAAAPPADFSDPSWGHVATPDFSIDFNIGQEEIVDSIMLHVRGGGAAVGFVADLLNHLDLRAIDCQSGDFFEPSSAAESMAAWRSYRDRVISDDR